MLQEIKFVVIYLVGILLGTVLGVVQAVMILTVAALFSLGLIFKSMMSHPVGVIVWIGLCIGLARASVYLF